MWLVSKSGHKAKPLGANTRMVGGKVIDLTGDDVQEQPIIDLTRSSSSPPSRSKLEESHLANGPHEETSKASNRRRRKPKTKKSDPQEPSSTEQDTSGGKPLLQRIQPLASETNQPSTSSENPVSKRKRRESVDSIAQSQAEARPPPPKRHKSQNLPPTVPNDDSSPSKESKNKKKSKNKSRQGSVDRQAPSSLQAEPPTGQNGSSSSPKKNSGSRNKKNNRSSQSPMPSTSGQGSKKHKPASRARSASVTSVPPSPAASISGLFFVDTVPNANNKHLEELPQVPYRVDSGNLLLPQHVLLESAEETLQTPGNEIYPPPSPGLSEGSIDLVDDSIRNVRRYWQPEPDTTKLEECRTCGQFHTSKLCIGTSVCFTCGSTTHQARRCPFKIACYRCGQTGHVQADCSVPRDDLRSSRDCYLCGSTAHGPHNCSRNWRIYKYRDANVRDEDIEGRVAMKPLVLAGDPSVDEEKYVGVEPWCYNCALMGHLGDDCLRERVDDRSHDASAFGIANVLHGPFGPRYRRVADDIYKQMDSNKYILFGDQLLDESSLALFQEQPPQYGYDATVPVPADMPLKPGKSGRQRERERLGRDKKGAEDDEDDWFSNRRERPAPVRNDRRDRDRDRRHDRPRGNSGRDRERERERDRDYRNDRRGGGTVLYSTRDGYSKDYDRPPEPSMSPPPMPPPATGYPSSIDMAAGYRQPSSSSTGISIRGAAASRPKGDRYEDLEPSRRGYGGSGKERNHSGRSHDRYDRGYRDRGSSGRSGRDRDRYEESGRRHDRY